MECRAVNPARDITESNPSPLHDAATYPDLFTIAAIAMVATVIADFIHEGLGHGGMCAATGGQPLVLSTVHFECSAEHSSGGGGRDARQSDLRSAVLRR